MEIKISGYVFATLEKVKEEIIVNLHKDNFCIEHEDLFTKVTVNGKVTIFENDVLIIK